MPPARLVTFPHGSAHIRGKAVPPPSSLRPSLAPQRDHRIHPRRAARRQPARQCRDRHEHDRATTAKVNGSFGPTPYSTPRRQRVSASAAGQPDRDAGSSPGRRRARRSSVHLAGIGAEGEPNADLPPPLVHEVGKHAVDADARRASTRSHRRARASTVSRRGRATASPITSSNVKTLVMVWSLSRLQMASRIGAPSPAERHLRAHDERGLHPGVLLVVEVDRGSAGSSIAVCRMSFTTPTICAESWPPKRQASCPRRSSPGTSASPAPGSRRRRAASRRDRPS